MTDLERRHDQLSGALIAVGRGMRQLPKTLTHVNLLALLRTTLVDAPKARKGA